MDDKAEVDAYQSAALANRQASATSQTAADTNHMVVDAGQRMVAASQAETVAFLRAISSRARLSMDTG